MVDPRCAGAVCVGLGLAVVAGCGPSLVVNTDYNPAMQSQIARWQTYAWLDHEDGDEPYVELDEARIRRALEDQLGAKGYTRVEEEQAADFLVAHHLSIERHFAVHDPPYYRGWYGWYDPIYGPWYPRGYGYAPAYISEWETGVLVVDLVDAARMELAWRGVAESRPLGRMDSPERRDAILTEAIAELLAEFPASRAGFVRPVSKR